MPGLLQTEAYAQALYATRVGLGPDDIDALVSARLARQHVLARAAPPMLWVILDEGVLRRPVCRASPAPLPTAKALGKGRSSPVTSKSRT